MTPYHIHIKSDGPHVKIFLSGGVNDKLTMNTEPGGAWQLRDSDGDVIQNIGKRTKPRAIGLALYHIEKSLTKDAKPKKRKRAALQERVSTSSALRQGQPALTQAMAESLRAGPRYSVDYISGFNTLASCSTADLLQLFVRGFEPDDLIGFVSDPYGWLPNPTSYPGSSCLSAGVMGAPYAFVMKSSHLERWDALNLQFFVKARQKAIDVRRGNWPRGTDSFNSPAERSAIIRTLSAFLESRGAHM